MYKFEKLKTVLFNNKENSIKLTESQLNELIEGGLSNNAFSSRSYFSNDPTHAIYKAWRSCGYYCSEVNRYEKYIVLTKLSSSKDKILSSDVLFAYFKNNISPDFYIVVTPFAFEDICRTKNINQKELAKYLIDKKASFVDFGGNFISFDEFYSIINTFGGKNKRLSHRMAETYKSFVIYVFATCLVNVGVDNDDIIDYFETTLDLPINYFNDISNSYSLRNSFYLLCSNIGQGINPEKTINKIKQLEYQYVQKYMVGCEPLELLFYDYALKNFIDCLRENDSFSIPTKVVEEMMNTSLLYICKNCIYLTNQIYTENILLGSLKNRVAIE